MRSVEQKIEPKDGGETTTKCKWGVVRILCTVLVALLMLTFFTTAATIIWLGPIVERFVESNDKELVGREVSMDNLSIKLFSGSVAVDNVVLMEEGDVEEFVRIGYPCYRGQYHPCVTPRGAESACRCGAGRRGV